jgi:ATP-dependent DNA helicase PIF1
MTTQKKKSLNSDQLSAFEALSGTENIFLTGFAGTGKSYLIDYFQKDPKGAKIPMVASTGAAAVLVRGRTFHSFFGLGIMAGGVQATVDKACRSDRIKRRISDADGIIIDEVSMLSGTTLSAAEQIARKIRGSTTPWGGLKIIAVGDFFQLPPVTRSDQPRDWVFQHEVWTQSGR